MKKNIQSLFDKFSVAEQAVFSGTKEFLSPVIAKQPIKVRIEGIILSFVVSPRTFEGWGVFAVRSQKEAEFRREASMTERLEYLSLYPKFNAIVYRQDKQPYAVINRSQYKSTTINGEIRVLLPENISQFDSVIVRWDGINFWYDEHNLNVNLANADRLRSLITDQIKPKDITLPGLTPAEIAAYALAYEDVKDKVQDKLENALRRSGSKLVRYVDRGNTYTVTYTVGTKEYTSTVDEGLRVQSAGICLSGGDKNFDLQSLVHVIKEGERQNRIVVGDYANYGYRGDYDDDE